MDDPTDACHPSVSAQPNPFPNLSPALARLQVSESAVKALVRLGQGDMRRVLNVLQVTALSPPYGEATRRLQLALHLN